MAKPVRLRRLAADDIDRAVTYLFTESGADVAAKFIAAIAAALGHVGRYPRRGTLRFSFELDIPGLRAWPLTRFPYLVFYVERDSEIDVWRVLHARRDVPATLADDDEDLRLLGDAGDEARRESLRRRSACQ